MRSPKLKTSADMALSVNLISAKELEDMTAFMQNFKLKYSNKKIVKSKSRTRK